MNFKCRFYSRTFSRLSAYSQHTLVCVKKVEIGEEDEENDFNDEIQDIDNISLESDDLSMNYIDDEV
jgi:hypothetical protein